MWASGRVYKVRPPFLLFFIHFTHILCFTALAPTTRLCQPLHCSNREQREFLAITTTHQPLRCSKHKWRGFFLSLCLPTPTVARNVSRGGFHATTTLHQPLRCSKRVFHATATPHQPLRRSKCKWRVSYHAANGNDNEDSCSQPTIKTTAPIAAAAAANNPQRQRGPHLKLPTTKTRGRAQWCVQFLFFFHFMY